MAEVAEPRWSRRGSLHFLWLKRCDAPNVRELVFCQANQLSRLYATFAKQPAEHQRKLRVAIVVLLVYLAPLAMQVLLDGPHVARLHRCGGTCLELRHDVRQFGRERGFEHAARELLLGL